MEIHPSKMRQQDLELAASLLSSRAGKVLLAYRQEILGQLRVTALSLKERSVAMPDGVTTTHETVSEQLSEIQGWAKALEAETQFVTSCASYLNKQKEKERKKKAHLARYGEDEED